MSEIGNEIKPKPHQRVRFRKKNIRVDLTPMVDLGFLLITFFVFTTQLSIPTAMNLNMPYDKVEPADQVCASCVMTLLLEAGNTIKYYEGMPALNPLISQTSFAPSGIRNIILKKKKAVQNITGGQDNFVLIIKASAGSTFQNFVDIIDEISINNVKHYYLDEITTADKKLFSIK
jgi:biopolymer transport protein ExbD